MMYPPGERAPGLGLPQIIVVLSLVVGLGHTAPAGAQTGSNASNYQDGAQLSVNDRTGDATVAVTLAKLPGIVSELGLSLALTYRADDARSAIQSNSRYFGLPFGWSLGLSFIYDDGTAFNLNVDGTQVYQLDSNWSTSFTPTGSTIPITAKTGLLQYNRADATLRTDNGSVTVNGLGSAYVFTNLGGQVQYFSAGGLLIREADRFGNHIDYHYTIQETGGAASESTTAANALLAALVDTWGHTVTLGPCLDPGSCVPDETRVTLPDGRTVGWVVPDAYTISQIIDTEGMVTQLQWQPSTCGDQSYGNVRLVGMTTPVGGMSALTYGCLDVCLAPSPTQCTQTTTWSVVDTLYECPNNASGTACPDGSPNGDYLTTTYQYGTTESSNNYTGYPRYSPYQPSVAGADPLMSAPDAGSFQYTTIRSKRRATGATFYQVQSDYNFLHLKQEERILVADGSSPTLMPSKVTSYCYPISDTAPTDGCPLTTASYENLPSNYQSPIITGSCQYNVGDTASNTEARRSVTTATYDAFGNVVRKRVYHGTAAQGIVPSCDRTTRLSTDGMQLVTEDDMQYDTPTTVDADGFVELGTGSGHFGLLLGQQSFVYLDPDDSSVGAHQALQDTTGPVLVKLLCSGLTTAGTDIATSTRGLMNTDAAAPATLGIIDACPQNGEVGGSWISTPAPPKTTTFTYDGAGRSLTQVMSWASGYTAPGGIASTSQTYAYSLSATTGGEEACPGDSSVLQIVSTDGQGHTTTNRACTLNGFHLSAADGNGNTTVMQHSPNGLTTKTTHADGTSVATAYYYACPVAQNGQTPTCPSTSTVLKDCPYDSQAQKRNCAAKTLSSGGQGSYADGVTTVTIRDGLGRIVEQLDDLGGSANGYTALETTKTRTFDDRGVVTQSTRSMGATNPLVYQTDFTLGPKLRPSLVCGPRGGSRQFVHDDVAQQTLTIVNGSARKLLATNDSHKLTSVADCDLVAGQTTSGTSCPTVASATDTAACPGDAYYTQTVYDGSGQQHSVTAMAGDMVDPGASVTSVNGVSTYSVDLLKYGYTFGSTNQANSQLSASATFTRDLQGKVLEHSLTVNETTDAGATPTPVTTSSDQYTFNNIGQKIQERNKLSDLSGAPVLEETYGYDPARNLASLTSYTGVEFQNYYDTRNRLVRHCFPTESGSEGETMELDPISGALLKITHFTNPGACSAGGDNDVDGVSETYTYTRFGAIESLTYSDGTRLEWGYDPYQRKACFADALATASDHHCPDSPIAVGYAPDPSEMLVWYRYWEDSDPYRRGLMQSQCRGVPDGNGGFVTKCLNADYYRPIDAGGACAASLSSIVGAYALMPRTETYCTGAPCDEGGTPVYQTTYSYDDHRRRCQVATLAANGTAILSTQYAYDQFDNVVHEASASDIDTSDDSNYQIDYVYDGLLRLIQETRNDLDGNLIKQTTYAYDAASNLIQKSEEEPDETGGEDTPTATATAATPTAPIASPTSPPATATRAPSTPTISPTATVSHDTDGCQVGAGSGSGWALLLPIALAALLRRRAPPARPAGRPRR